MGEGAGAEGGCWSLVPRGEEGEEETLRRGLSSSGPGRSHRPRDAERRRATSRATVGGRPGPAPSGQLRGPWEQEGAGPGRDGTRRHRAGRARRSEPDRRREIGREDGRHRWSIPDSRPRGCWRGGAAWRGRRTAGPSRPAPKPRRPSLAHILGTSLDRPLPASPALPHPYPHPHSTAALAPHSPECQYHPCRLDEWKPLVSTLGLWDSPPHESL